MAVVSLGFSEFQQFAALRTGWSKAFDEWSMTQLDFTQQCKVMSFFNKYLLSDFAFILIAVSSSAQQAPSSVVHLTDKNEPGKPFTLDIKVLAIDSKEPVAGVEVFAYHTNSKGAYEEDDSGVPRIHGTAVSDASGNVTFITIYPRGYYDSPTGEHIHFRIKGTNLVASNTDLIFSDF